jgi:hypothetical protein
MPCGTLPSKRSQGSGEACGGAHYSLARSRTRTRSAADESTLRTAKWDKNDARDAEVICEAEPRLSMWFVVVKPGAARRTCAASGARAANPSTHGIYEPEAQSAGWKRGSRLRRAQHHDVGRWARWQFRIELSAWLGRRPRQHSSG